MHEASLIGARHQVSVLLVAVIWQESSFCVANVGDDGKSFGCGQIQLHTAASVAGHRVSRYALIHNRFLNLELSARFLEHCVKRFGFKRGLYCYNRGEPKAIHAKDADIEYDLYVNSVLARVSQIWSLNHVH